MLKNFIWQRENEPQNALSYVFLYMNFVYGVTFLFAQNAAVVQNSAWATSVLPPELWGFATLALVITTVFAIATRNRFIGEIVGFWGFLLWGYGFVLYAIYHMWFSAFVIYMGQMLFWAFWYIGVKRFYAKEDLLVKILKEERDNAD